MHIQGPVSRQAKQRIWRGLVSLASALGNVSKDGYTIDLPDLWAHEQRICSRKMGSKAREVNAAVKRESAAHEHGSWAEHVCLGRCELSSAPLDRSRRWRR